MAFPGTALATTLLAIGGLVACGGPAPSPDDDAITLRDPTGRTVTLDAPARRVVSMMPAFTEWVIALGAADRLVARTDYDDHPAIADLPSVGGGLTASVEWLAARRPDLVIAWPDAPSRSLVSRLDALGVPVYTAPSETIEDAFVVVGDLGRLLGLEGPADSATAAVRAGLDSVRAGVRGRARPRTLFLIGLDPVTAAGPATFLDQLLQAAGARNILEGTALRWPQLSLEDIVARAPDVIIVGTTAADPAARLAGRPGWRDVPAVRNGRVHAVDPDRVNRPGPTLHESARLLARLLHGDALP